ncbi:MAG TPA: hypothetical protein VMV46_16365 [Thermoanaerobaculia bacterium]|nr:hypothetical protein [Thermoanaerobaculia bacterium]
MTATTCPTDTAAELIAEARARGLHLRVAGPGDLRVGPLDRLDPDLTARLKAAKAELIELLSARAREPITGSAEAIGRMDLAGFAAGDQAIRCRSRALGYFEVIFAGERARLPDCWQGIPVFRGEELLLLAEIQPNPVELRQLHAVRELFGTTLAEVLDRDPEEAQA